MYLKFVRHFQLGGNISRGKLYSVHFQPNEKGGYNENLTLICDAYELPRGDVYPLPLVYSAGVRCVHGHMRLAFGRGQQQATLHLIEPRARDAFFIRLVCALREREETLVEVAAFDK
jgi:hypothetical protein